MKEIPLTRGKVALVDDEDYPWLSEVSWHCHGNYAATSVKRRKAVVLMHRLILLPPKGVTVDHINHDMLDNRRANLRLATMTQQNGNQRKTRGTSRFKGVKRRYDGKKWVAQIQFLSRDRFPSTRYLGSFEDEIAAAKAYNDAALKYFGEYALLNKV